MARIACIVMLRDERTMAPRFLGYHAALFGIENVHVFDNGSTDPQVLAELERFEAKGGHVNRGHKTAEDFRHRNDIIGGLIRRLDQAGEHDFHIPLDCDEFLTLKTDDGYTADPQAILAHLDTLRGGNSALGVSRSLVNVLGSPGLFYRAACMKPVWPRGVPGHDPAVPTGDDARPDCGLATVHFRNRPYEEALIFARQKLRTDLGDDEIAEPSGLRRYQGQWAEAAADILDGAETYYRRFRTATNVVAFPGLADRFAGLGLEIPFATFRLPAAPAGTRRAAPLVVVDEASMTRVRGWAIDEAAPASPVQLRFLVNGAPIWEGTCRDPRPDVRQVGHPTDRVGFDIAVQPGSLLDARSVLTVEDPTGMPVPVRVGGHAHHGVALAAAAEPPGNQVAAFGHIDSFRNGRVHGWALRSVPVPGGARLLGGCMVAMVHGGRVVGATVADIVRPDVAVATSGEEKCGFSLDVPRDLVAPGKDPLLRLFVMPEHHELAGSPCIMSVGRAAGPGRA